MAGNGRKLNNDQTKANNQQITRSSFRCLVSLKLHPCDNRFQPDLNIFNSLNSISMSTPVDTSLAGLKEITAQIVGIISGGWQIPAGNAHMALTSQVTDLVVCNISYLSFVLSNVWEGSGHPGLWERSPHPRHRVVLLKGVDASSGHVTPGLAQLAQHQL
jgi:hypothetical protein